MTKAVGLSNAAMKVPDFLDDSLITDAVTADKSLSKLQGKVKDLKIAHVVPNAWNPNTMDDREFDQLVRKLQKYGMLDPLQVVAFPEGHENAGKYMLIGGEHRWRAAQILEWDTVPCLICTGDLLQEEDEQRFVTMQMNIIAGHLDPEKFIVLYNDLAKKYSKEMISDSMGYAHKAAFNRLVNQMAEGLPDEKQAEFKEKASKVGGDTTKLAKIVQELMSEHGDDLKWNFMVFSAEKGSSKEVLWLKCDDEVFSLARQMTDYCRARGMDINEFLTEALTRGLEAYK